MEKITQEKLQDALQNQDSFLAFYVDVEPVDLALAIENLDDDDIQKICQWLEDEPLSELIEDADDDLRLRLSSFIDDHRLLSVFNFMQKDDIVDIIGDLPTGRKKALINLMRSGDQKIIKELLKYPEESAGGIMTTSYIAIKANWTVAQSLQRIREIADKSEVIETLYVIDVTKRLIGEVDLRNMLGAQKAQRISTIMNDSVISVQPEVDQEQVARLVSRYDLTSIPVVNKRGAILGIITVDDVIDVIVEEYEEDMLQMAGVNREEDLSSTLSESIRMRLPWLMVNLLTAFLASFTVKMFQNTIEQVVALSATMTIVTGMGGNAGTQTMSILVRELAKREIPLKENWKALVKELLLSVVDGAATGIVTAIIVYFMYGNFYLALIIFIAMIGNLLVSGLFGFLVPLGLKKLHADPAISSTIFVTTATDVLGFFIFLGLAKLFISHLAGM